MIKIETATLEDAYKKASLTLGCSVTELIIEVVQAPSSGFLGLFKKNAIIVAAKKADNIDTVSVKIVEEPIFSQKKEITPSQTKEMRQKRVSETEKKIKEEPKESRREELENKKTIEQKPKHHYLNNMIMPQTFVSMQDDEDYDMADINYTADYEEDMSDVQAESNKTAVNKEAVKNIEQLSEIAKNVENEINHLFDFACFNIDKIKVSVYDENTLFVEFKGEDAALLIGKEGYRYKALSYMIFNWINSKYQLQLRLEIAEFLKNQEESIGRYLVGVYENIDRDGRAQTKILDGVLIQIALRELRSRYANKYVAIRSTRDGLKFIIINDYHNQ